MVAAVVAEQFKKSDDKIPSVPLSKTCSKLAKRDDQSSSSPRSVAHELEALKVRNKVLTQALQAIKEKAEETTKQYHDLVFYAKYRSRYPNHKDRKRIETQYAKELEKLKTYDADFYHGQHTGFLAASRLFHQHADILEINQHTEVTPQMMALVERHGETIERSRQSFPDLTIDPCGD